MKGLVATVAAAAAATLLLGRPAAAQLYPIAPPGTFISLPDNAFIQSVPEQSWWLPHPNPVVGHNLAQHPGAFGTGFPALDSYFIGVLGTPIDPREPGAVVYLWETSGHYFDLGPLPPPYPFGPPPTSYPPEVGPQIEVGHWGDWYDPGWPNPPSLFTPYGTALAYYQGTGYLVPVGTMGPYTDWSEVGSSVTPLRDFGILPGFSHTINAVRITAVDPNAHNQVVALAFRVPEPSAVPLFGVGLAALFGFVWNRGRTRRSKSRGARV